MKRELKVQKGTQDKISSDRFGYVCPWGTGYTKMRIEHNILISGKLPYPASPSPPPKMPDKAFFTLPLNQLQKRNT